MSGARVTLYDKAETVTIVLDTPECYGIEGVWSVTADGKTNEISLKNIQTSFTISSGDKLDVNTGKVMWTDLTFDNPASGTNLMVATYKIPADTPAGKYIVTFKRDVFTGADYNPIDTDVIYSAFITVTHHTCSDAANDGDHKCDDPLCGKDGVTPHTHGSYGKDAVNHWSICAECGQKIETTTASHNFADGDCVCGAKPLGDVNQDGKVNADDLTLLARHVSGIRAITDDTALANADVNEDGKINAQDLTLLAQYINGLINKWKEDV